MKVTITDPKQEKPRLTMRDLSPGTLFEMTTKAGEPYIGMIVRGESGMINSVVRLNGTPVYTISVENSWHKKEEVNIINSVELSTK